MTKENQMVERESLKDVAKNIRRAAIEDCAKVCDEQIKAFLSPEYATDQPLSSFAERFAAAECARAIRALQNPEPK